MKDDQRIPSAVTTVSSGQGLPRLDQFPTRFSSLDGLRAVSIILVIAQHMSSAHRLGPDYLWRFQLGDLGVRIFFVISGFLITSLLLKEHSRYGYIDLRRFYARRFLRIFPAYYAFLGIVFLLALAGWIAASPRDFIGPVLYLSNYIGTSRILGHAWSLAVEQQFYLLWPVLLVVAGIRFGAKAAIVVLCAVPFIRLLLTMHAAHAATLWIHFETTCDAIAAGCAFAIYRDKLWVMRWYRAILSQPMMLLIIVSMFLLATSHRWPLFWNGPGIFLMNLLAVFLIDGAMRLEGCTLYRVLNSRPLVFVGVISYSLYIWQQLFAYGRLDISLPASLVLMFAVAMASYYLIEKPALRLKRRVAK